MILTDKEIRKLCMDTKAKKNDKSLIFPFSEEALQSESYDLAIGTDIAVLKKEVKCISLYDQDDIDNMYEEIDLSIAGYTISPKEYLLVSLNEKINLPDNITAHIRPRTRFTRLGLLISDQHCNSTYSGKLKIGLFNAPDYAIKIFPGIRIAQMVFEELKSKPSDDKLYKNKQNAIYQNEEKFIGAKISDEFDEKVLDTVNLLLKKEK